MKPRKAQVGVRQLKANLSAYLRRAAAGEQIEVTDRGHPVATIGPPPAQQPLSREELERRMQKMEKEGRLIRAEKPGGFSFLRKWKRIGPPLTKAQRAAIRRDLDWSREDKV